MSFLSAAVIPAAATLSIWELVAQADAVVKSVMVVLVLFSVVSWAIIIQRALLISRASKQSISFLDFFWSTSSLDEAQAVVKKYPDSPIAATFAAGYRELRRLNEAESGTGQSLLGGGLTNVGRALRRSASESLTRLERSIPFLASCGSAAPFIGLFGTVWGIMKAFDVIGETGSTSIAQVGPAISEALFATALGLFAAIPAVLFFNYFATRLKVLSTEINNFNSDFLNLLERHERSRLTPQGSGTQRPPV
ncbi:MAG: protein TolQ [Myxococcota bacterium]|nr:protein TolQ [Myxococcota bacterium]